MGLMDSMKTAVSNELESRFSQVAAQHPVASQLLSTFGNGNQMKGLGELISTFRQKGLGGIVNSWVSTGANLPINADQIEQALGPERLQQIASKVGTDPQVLKEQLAKVLPMAVDRLTPNGRVEG